MKKSILSILLVITGVCSAFAQDIVTLIGKVVDSGTSSPLALVSVNLNGTNISNITNSDGIFSLKVPVDTDPQAAVSLRYLGYMTADYPVSEFLDLRAGDALLIRMLPINLDINPSIIRSVDPETLFSTAFSFIRKNYHTSPVGMTAFYREMVKKGTQRYLVLNEAVVDIEKSSYQGFGADKASIYKGRGTTDYNASDTLFIKFQGGLYSALELDIVKNPFVGTSLQAATLYYKFSLGETVTINDRPFYTLHFEPKEGAEPILFRGDIFIDPETLAIGRMEFEMAVEGREEEASGTFVVKQPAKMRFAVNSAKYVVNYKEADGVWYFDYSRADVAFNVRKRGSLFKGSYSITGEIAVTDHKKGEFHVDPEMRVKFKDILANKVAAFEDPDFWESYNVIEPDQSIDQAIRKIIRQLRKRED